MEHEASQYSRLSNRFTRAIRSHERLLPQSILEQYLENHLDKREVLLESALKFGTPQYFFDEPSLIIKVTQFKSAFTEHLPRHRLFYAMKSNSFSGICEKILEEGIGLDVSSGSELSKALTVGCKKIVFSGPGKTDEELVLAVKNRARVVLLMDSFGEFQRVSDLINRESLTENPVKTGIRIQHQGSWGKFGIPLKDLGVILKKAHRVKGMNLCGVQFHTSWNLNSCAQVAMINEIGSYLTRNVPSHRLSQLEFFDIGGGFWPEQGEWLNFQNTLKGKLVELLNPETPVVRKHYYRKAAPIDHFAREIAKALSQQDCPINRLEIWAEPGRWISTSAMHVILKVVDKKDRKTVITDGGTNLLGWERPLAEFVPVLNLTKPSMKERSLKVYGALCTPYDVWGTSVFGSDTSTGDFLLVPDQGAYTYSLRQSFIKPTARVIHYNGDNLQCINNSVTT
jgi:diaminopimelate decarboxylase